MKRLMSLLPLTLVLLACAACGPSNTVRLLYSPADSSLLPAPNAPAAVVVQFADKRDKSQLGVRRDNSAFQGNESEVAWVSRSMADALAKQGVQVAYADNLGQANTAHPAYIVTGSLEEAWLQESSATDLAVTLRATVRLSSAKGVLMTETLSASQSRTGLPSSTAAEDLLRDTMQELVQPAAQKLYAKMRGQ